MAEGTANDYWPYIEAIRKDFVKAEQRILSTILRGGMASGELDVKTFFEQKMSESFKADAAEGVDVIFQFNISGKGGGDWYCVVKDKACTIEAGTHATPKCTLKMGDADFLAMMTGKLPAMQAYTSGKLQIEGDIIKSQLIEQLFTI